MSYLNLNRSELKELIDIKMLDLVKYLLALATLILLYYAFTGTVLTTMGSSERLFAFIAILTIYFIVFWKRNKDFIIELIKKQKKVYRGVLGMKTISSSNKFFLHMDGYVFSVPKEEYNSFNEGDLLEFHISPSTKHLFKVVKVK